MARKDTERFERMKRTGFGVEIEMNHITRRRAAQTAASVLCESAQSAQEAVQDAGFGNYCVYDSTGRAWTFQKDGSIHGPDDEKCEMATPVLFYERDMELLQKTVRALRRAGARSSASEGCGVHVHISGEGHTVRTLLNMVNLMASHEQQLIRAIGIEDERRRKYCKTVDPAFLERVKKEKPKNMQALQECWYNGHVQTGHFSSTRYRMLNLHSYFTRYHTIEFRLFQFDETNEQHRGGLHAGHLRAMVLLCLAMNDMALRQRQVRMHVQQSENEAYALRCFLLRLGFVGDEFKAPRAYFIRNARGNSAWRYGEPTRRRP